MTAQNITLKKYYRSIRRELLCPADTKKMILSQLHQNIAAFLEESPNADLSAIHAHFGTPRQIANAYLEELSAPELSRKLRLRRRIIAVTLAALFSAVAIWGIGVGLALIDSHQTSNPTIETSITEE